MRYETKDEILALIDRRCEITKQKSDKAKRDADTTSYYRHNTALHELWKLRDLITGKAPKSEQPQVDVAQFVKTL